MFGVGDSVMFRGEQVLVVEKFTSEKYKNFKLRRNAIYVVEFQGGFRQDVMESDLERVGHYVEKNASENERGVKPNHPNVRCIVRSNEKKLIEDEDAVNKALIDAHLRFGQYDVVRGLSEK